MTIDKQHTKSGKTTTYNEEKKEEKLKNITELITKWGSVVAKVIHPENQRNGTEHTTTIHSENMYSSAETNHKIFARINMWFPRIYLESRVVYCQILKNNSFAVNFFLPVRLSVCVYVSVSVT